MMEKRSNICALGKRGVALLMTMIMTFGMLQIQVFAAGSEENAFDVTIEQSAPLLAALDEIFEYTLEVRSAGGATGVVVQDTLPAGVELVAEEGAAYIYDAATRTLTWSIGALDAGDCVELAFTVVAREISPAMNVAVVTGDGGVEAEAEFTTEIMDVPAIEIPEDDAPLADLPDEDVPMADVPETGETMIYRVLAVISGVTLLALAVTGRKGKEEEMA